MGTLGCPSPAVVLFTIAVSVIGCGAATGLGEEEPPVVEDGGGECPAPRADSMRYDESCAESPVCDGVFLFTRSSGGGGSGEEALHMWVTVVNCGGTDVPPCVDVSVRGRRGESDLALVARGRTSLVLAPGWGEAVPVDVPWESWRGYLEEDPNFCLETIIDAEDRVLQCEYPDYVVEPMPTLAGSGCGDDL